MGRPAEIGNIQIYPQRPLRDSDKNGFVLKFFCPVAGKRVRKNAGTRDRKEARRILRECRERLLNGKYAASGGAITVEREKTRSTVMQVLSGHVHSGAEDNSVRTWTECVDRYLEYKRNRVREKTYDDIISRLKIATRIFVNRELDFGKPAADTPVADQCTLESMEYLQDRLLQGDECRYEQRAHMTVNTTMGAIMSFVRYCRRHRWISEVPPVERLDIESPMKGRPITAAEFELLLDSAASVVGAGVADSWKFTLEVLWQTAFRIADVMDFSWDDHRVIHPVWPDETHEYPTLAIPAKQKNRKFQEIPMLLGLRELLDSVPEQKRRSWVVDPRPMEFLRDEKRTWVKPCDSDLRVLAPVYSNSAIGRACEVSEAAVRKWLSQTGMEKLHRGNEKEIPKATVTQIWERGQQEGTTVTQNQSERLTKDRVGRVISLIGKAANIVVCQPDLAGKRIKYASAHDIRRGCAQRLINEGVSAETLKLILRHSDFATTEKYYGAVRSAQAAAKEIHHLGKDGRNKTGLTDSEISRIRKMLDRE